MSSLRSRHFGVRMVRICPFTKRLWLTNESDVWRSGKTPLFLLNLFRLPTIPVGRRILKTMLCNSGGVWLNSTDLRSLVLRCHALHLSPPALLLPKARIQDLYPLRSLTLATQSSSDTP